MFKIFRNNIPKFNWQYALGELVLLFTGITLSLWFNDWSDANKQRDIEIKTLKEIKHEILLDTIDINTNIRGYQNLVKNDSIIRYLIEHNDPDSASAYQSYFLLDNYSLINLHTSAYETLKSRGIETIRNDSLRLSIVRLHDFDYKQLKHLENEGMMRQSHERMYPHFIRNFRITTRVVKGIPRVVIIPKHYQAWRNDMDFQTVFIHNAIIRSVILEEYKKVRNKILKLSRDIDAEIKSAEG